jgi:hypothetical protein
MAGYTPFTDSFTDEMYKNAGMANPSNPSITDIVPTAGADAASKSWSELLFGKMNGNTGINPGGMALPLLGAGSALLNGYTGFQNMKLAKDTLDFQKNAFSKQFENQRTLVNNEIRDREAVRQRQDSSYKPSLQTV